MTQPVSLEPTDSTGEELRQALRRAVKMRAHLRDRGQTRFEIEVTDLSLSGFRAETSFTLWPGTVVWLTLPGLAALEAVVAWRDKFKYGCAFAKPLHPAVFEHIVGAKPAIGAATPAPVHDRSGAQSQARPVGRPSESIRRRLCRP